MENNQNQFAFVPYDKMEELLQKVNILTEAVLNNTNQDRAGLGDLMPEEEAKALLSRGTTWFWEKRKSGELKAKKAGNKWYYKRSDILKFIENGRSSC